MGTVASSNNGLSTLLQTLSNENSPLLSTLSSPSVESALEKAPTSDIVQISEQAFQLQATDELFGIAPSTPGSLLTDPLATYQGNQQIQQTEALFGLTPTTTTTDPLLNVLG